MIDPKVEELLEHWYVEQVEAGEPAGEFSDETVAAAEELGLVERDGDRRVLTEAGTGAARDVVRRHRLAERLLRDVLAVSDEMLDDDACRFEHLLRPGLEERICALLGHPATCPHGKAIPPADCCRRAKEEATKEVGALSAAEPGAEGTVAYLTTRDQKDIQKLMALGILPGAPIRVERQFPAHVFSVGYSQFTVDRELAEKIMVRWYSRPEPRHGRRRTGFCFGRRRRGR